MTTPIFANQILKAQIELAKISSLCYQYNKRVLVYQYDKVKLYHYESKFKKPHAKPLLIVFATVNRPEILDLFPEHSFIGHLLKQGLDIYLLDWGYPDKHDAHLSMNDYINRYLKSCVQFMCEQTAQPKINLLGICQGGLICLLYSLLHQTINKLVLISCPIDFHTDDNVISNLFRKIDIDILIKLSGNIPGFLLTHLFISLRPFELVGKKYLQFVDNIHSSVETARFLQIEKWLHDAPDQTAVSFIELLTDFYCHNKLIQGTLTLNGKRINLANLSFPVLNIMAKRDEIIPISATRCLKQYVNRDLYTERYFDSGHIGIYVSDKVGKAMPKAIAKWVEKI